MFSVNFAPIAQLDRVSVYETGGCTFESCWARIHPFESQVVKSMITEFRSHEYYMQLAIAEAEKAFKSDEVPVGVIIIYENSIIAKAHNQRELLSDPTAHAEMIAITQASAYLQNWRLSNTTVYVTLEPCTMCAGALVQARVKNLVYGAKDEKNGACESIVNLVNDPHLNHRLNVVSGVLENECSLLLKQFFLEKCRDD